MTTQYAERRAFVDDLPVSLPLPRVHEYAACVEMGRLWLAIQDDNAPSEADPALLASIRTFFRYLRDCATASGDLDLAAWADVCVSASGRRRIAARPWTIRSEGRPDSIGYAAAFTDAQLQSALVAQ